MISGIEERVASLDVGLFSIIHDQMEIGDERSLLAVQRATAKHHEQYVYLEIGSHLGGTIQPHLLDGRCKQIYSIDPRPLSQPDDRKPGFIVTYEGNSTERMLEQLRVVDSDAICKVQCFEMDASEIDPEQIAIKPEIALIDGEHTVRAVLSDFRFCEKVISPNGTIIFGDFVIIYPAIFEITKLLNKGGKKYLPLKLDSDLFAIFFDNGKVFSDPYLNSSYNRHKHFLFWYHMRRRMQRILPQLIWNGLVRVRDAVTVR